MEKGKSHPNEENLGKPCKYWELGAKAVGCCFPKFEMVGRTSCQGQIDELCLYLKDHRKPSSLSKEEVVELDARIPNSGIRFKILNKNT